VPSPAGLPLAAHPPSAALDQDLGFTLGVIFRGYVKEATAAVNDIPGGPRGYQILVAASQHQADNQGALAQRLGVDRTVMTYLIDDLETAGLVERRADLTDRRSRHVVATLHGRQLWAATEKRLQDVEDRVLRPLSTAERATFRSMLHRLAARANALDPISSPCDVVDEVNAALEPETSVTPNPSIRRRSSRHRRIA
jgi:DNA-binding MarR family transcriptional regulator